MSHVPCPWQPRLDEEDSCCYAYFEEDGSFSCHHWFDDEDNPTRIAHILGFLLLSPIWGPCSFVLCAAYVYTHVCGCYGEKYQETQRQSLATIVTAHTEPSGAGPEEAPTQAAM